MRFGKIEADYEGNLRAFAELFKMYLLRRSSFNIFQNRVTILVFKIISMQMQRQGKVTRYYIKIEKTARNRIIHSKAFKEFIRLLEW